MDFTLKLFSVVMLVGPSQCGKTVFAQALSRALAAFSGVRVAHLSSDDFRRMLAGPLDKYDPRMGEVSGGAFKMLETALEAHLAWPATTEVVIVDTTGLNADFRDVIFQAAERHNYHTHLVVFDYSHGDYLKGATAASRQTVLEHAKRMKEDVLPGLKRKRYSQVTRMRKRDFDHYADLRVSVPEHALFTATRWSNETPVALIGDVHESVDAFNALRAKLPTGIRTLQLGDWIDKGEDVAGIVAAMERFRDAGGQWLLGNHESYVAKRITGDLTEMTAAEAEYFTAIKTLQADPALAERFLALVHQALPFVVLQGQGGRTVYVSHAPAELKYLGKLDADSLRNQRNLRVGTQDDAELQALVATLGKIGRVEPMHVFGHVAHRSRVFQRGRVFLDTGAVYGEKLSALVLNPGRAPELVQVDSAARAAGTLFNLDARPSDAADAPLPPVAPGQQAYFNKFVESGARFVAGTIAPAPATQTTLESAEAGLKLLRENGMTEVVVQPKYMGSRAQVYLFKDAPEKNFAVSRNGYVVKNPLVQGVLEDLHARFAPQSFWNESLILDGELMPWRVLGGSLIDSEFDRYRAAAGAELMALADDPVFQGFAVGTAYRTAERRQGLATFEKQVALYGAEADAHFKAFSVLAVDGEEWMGRDQAEIFSLVAPDEPVLVLDLRADDALPTFEAFFTALTQRGQMEGVVIKPRVFQAEFLPAMKVRNEDYLHIIYGYDYKLRYETMCAQKKTRKKMAVSRREFSLGRQMLQAPTNEALLGALIRMQGELAHEATLDPRL